MKQQTKDIRMFKEYIKAKYDTPYFIENFISLNNALNNGRIKLKD